MTDSALPAVIQAMLKPDFYPHAVTEPIELIQTHISYVFLTGDYVYKLKKPVNYGSPHLKNANILPKKKCGLISAGPGNSTWGWNP